MSERYVLSLEAADDLFEIWDYLRKEASDAVADRVENTFRERLRSSPTTPAPGILEKT